MPLELQLVDVTTCKARQPLVDIWPCDATKVYSGVNAAGEGGLSATFICGVQQTDANGVVNFDTNSPASTQEEQPTIIFLPTPVPKLTRTAHSVVEMRHISHKCSSVLRSSTLLKLQLYITSKV
jgi:protocatechuate 3,4-dioxygenase beta subunit